MLTSSVITPKKWPLHHHRNDHQHHHHHHHHHYQKLTLVHSGSGVIRWNFSGDSFILFTWETEIMIYIEICIMIKIMVDEYSATWYWVNSISRSICRSKPFMPCQRKWFNIGSFVFWPKRVVGLKSINTALKKAPKLPLFGQSIPSLTLPTSPYLPLISTGAKTWKCRCAGHTGSPGFQILKR